MTANISVATEIRVENGSVYQGGLLMYRETPQHREAEIYARYLREIELARWPHSIAMPTFEDWKKRTLA
jgi:hypothetical protein